MRNENRKKILGGLVAASLAVAMAPMQEAQAPLHFINDRGEMMVVDPPSPSRQPVFVAMPVSQDAAKPAAQDVKPGG